MSLTWERPTLALRRWRRRDIAAQNLGTRTKPASSSELTPLKMTIVGALLIAIGPLSMSLYTPAMTLLIDALHTSAITPVTAPVAALAIPTPIGRRRPSGGRSEGPRRKWR